MYLCLDVIDDWATLKQDENIMFKIPVSCPLEREF